MPVNLTKQNTKKKAAAVPAFTPKFFDPNLTGTNTRPGLLQDTEAQCRATGVPSYPDASMYSVIKKSTKSQGTTKITQIPVSPFFPITSSNGPYNLDRAAALLLDAVLGGGMNVPLADGYSAAFYIRSMILKETESAHAFNSVKTRQLYVQYGLSLWFEDSTNLRYVFNEAGEDKYALLNELKDECTYEQVSVDLQPIENLVVTSSIYDLLCKQSEIWQSKMFDLFNELVQRLDHFYYKLYKINDQQYALPLYRQIAYMENYRLDSSLYEKIYTLIASKNAAWIDMAYLCQQNLNLLLYKTMDELKKASPSLMTMPQQAALISPPSFFSAEQSAIISSYEPLILCQSGAGTGKSTVLKGRINHLISSGVFPADIMILSFTNAAADNLRDSYPGVKCMTIASMIHGIYSSYMPKQALSQIPTMKNALALLSNKTNNSSIGDFINILDKIDRNIAGSMTVLNGFVSQNLNDVFSWLDQIGLICMELEIIICYQMIHQWQIPLDYSCCFCMVDEVQDSNLFEFIYILSLCAKSKFALLLIGDSSQTLYEFRQADPRVMNIIEKSGIFALFKLTTNYRSRQEILAMANPLLDSIEANQNARIQLQSNFLSSVDKLSFLDKVVCTYTSLASTANLPDKLAGTFSAKLYPWLRDRFSAKENVAVIGSSRRIVKAVVDLINGAFPGLTSVSLSANRQYTSTILSAYIHEYMDSDLAGVDLSKARIADLCYGQMQQLISNKLSRASKRSSAQVMAQKTAAAQRETEYLQKWFGTQSADILVQQNLFLCNQMTRDELINKVQKMMLDYESAINRQAMALTSAANQKRKDQDLSAMDFVYSTVHSVKGLEFDNVIVVVEEGFEMPEETKRLLYVALTRAKKKEFILSFGKKPDGFLKGMHSLILDKLP